MDMFVRLRPFTPRLGFNVQRLHYKGVLFEGGQRPTWYKVDASDATQYKTVKQDSGAPMFDIMNIEEKQSADQDETAIHLAALGLATATAAAPPQKTAVDLTTARRKDALPEKGLITPAMGPPPVRSGAIPTETPGFETIEPK